MLYLEFFSKLYIDLLLLDLTQDFHVLHDSETCCWLKRLPSTHSPPSPYPIPFYRMKKATNE